jgi:hypothetical protein
MVVMQSGKNGCFAYEKAKGSLAQCTTLGGWCLLPSRCVKKWDF